MSQLDTRPASCTLSPDTLEIVAGASAGLTASFKDSRGLSTEAAEVVWTSDAPAIAAVDKKGTVTGNGRGEAHVFAQAGSITCAPVRITVKDLRACSVGLQPASLDLRIGDTRKLTATVANCAGDLLPDAKVIWASDAPSKVKVDDSGMVTALATGEASIVAGSGAKVSTPAVVTVETNVAAVHIVPSPLPMFTPGATLQLDTTVVDATGAALTGKSATWTSSDNSIAAVDTGGMLHALAIGTVTITAAIEGVPDNATATVQDITPASVVIAPTSMVSAIGVTTPMTAVVFNAAGNPISDAGVAWTSSNTQVATITQKGVVSALAYGTAQIIATSGPRVSAPALVTVTTSVALVRITPSPVSPLTVGASAQLTATAVDGTGATLTGRPVVWTSDNASVRVDSNGLISAVSIGSANVTANIEGAVATASVTVLDTTPASVAVSPTRMSLKIGATSQASAVVSNAAGNPIAGATIAWVSDNPNVATVATNGLITAVAFGTANVTAASGAKTSAPMPVTVATNVFAVHITPSPVSPLSVGGSAQLSASAVDANGAPLSGRPCTWSSDNASVRVDSSGLSKAISVGSANVSATIEGVTTSVSVAVLDTTPVSISVTPTSASLKIGGTVQFVATVSNAAGDPIAGAPVTWASDNSDVATVAPSGLLSAVVYGAANVRASSGAKTSAPVPVTVATSVAAVHLSPSPVPPLAVGGSLLLSAYATDVSGTVLSGKSATWSSDNTSVLVDSSGLLHAISIGSATVTATIEEVRASTSVTVLDTTPASIAVSPSSLSMIIGTTSQLAATVSNAAGNPISGAVVSWTSNNANVATVATNGLVTALGYGSAIVTASSGSVTRQVAVAVNTNITQVAITPVPLAPLAVGGTAQLAFTATDASGKVLTGKTAAWQMGDNSGFASVSSTGLVTGVGPGPTSVTVTVEGLSNNQPLLVFTPPSVQSLSPNSGPVGTSVTIGGTGFGATPGSSTVAFETTQLSSTNITSWTATQIVVTVPASLTSGSAYHVVVTANGRASNNTQIFNVTSPVATVTLMPSTAYLALGSTANFTFTAKDGNGAALTGRAQVWSVDNTAIATVTPQSDGKALVRAVAVGTAKVNVTVDGIAPPLPSAVVVEQAPVITTVSPASGPPLTAITVTGKNLLGKVGQSLSFLPVGGGTSVAAQPSDILFWSATQILVTAPAALTAGTYGLQVTLDATVPSNADQTFRMTGDQVITGIHPQSGPQGATLQLSITGFNLSTAQGLCTVSLFRSGVLDTKLTVHNPPILDPSPGGRVQQIHLTMDIDSTAPLGTRTVSCGNSGTAVTPQNAFTVMLQEGFITTSAGGSALPGLGDGGPATFAKFSSVYGLAVGGSGEYYIGDTGNNRVRVVNDGPAAITVAGVTLAPGNIATIAGGGGVIDSTAAAFSGDDGLAVNSQLSGPRGIAYDAVRKLLFIADAGNFRVRAVNLGTVTQVLQVGTAASKTLSLPPGFIGTVAGGAICCNGPTDYVDALGAYVPVAAVAVAPDGPADARTLLYILEPGNSSGNGRIRVLNTDPNTKVVSDVALGSGGFPQGMVVPVAGQLGSPGGFGDGGPASKAQFNSPSGMAFGPRGLLYISDTGNAALRVINTLAPTNLFGPLPAAGGVGVSSLAGNIDHVASVGAMAPAAGPFGEVFYPDPFGSGTCAVRFLNTGDAPVFRLGAWVPNNSTVSLTSATCGNSAGDGGPSTSATLSSPLTAAYAAATGILYIAEWNRVRKVQLVYVHDPRGGDQGVWPAALAQAPSNSTAAFDTDLGTLTYNVGAGATTLNYGPTGGTFSFTSPVLIPATLTLTITGSHPAAISSQGAVTVGGTISVANNKGFSPLTGNWTAIVRGSHSAKTVNSNGPTGYAYGNSALSPLTPGTTAVINGNCGVAATAAGGGALELYSATDLTVSSGGSVNAVGAVAKAVDCVSSSQTYAAYGSGGGLRLVGVNSVTVSGTVNALGGSDSNNAGSAGRIHLEAPTTSSPGTITPAATSGQVVVPPWF